jgi:hypothetical protein
MSPFANEVRAELESGDTVTVYIDVDGLSIKLAREDGSFLFQAITSLDVSMLYSLFGTVMARAPNYER